MKISFDKIFRSHYKSIPKEFDEQLKISFPNAKNIDWEIKDDTYEAIFYVDDIEHIAKLSRAGSLIEYKKNHWIEELPESVKIGGNSFGEIMNVIIIYSGNEIFYELIVRNEKFDRFEYLFNNFGVVLRSKKL